jgi:hypothetical protein
VRVQVMNAVGRMRSRGVADDADGRAPCPRRVVQPRWRRSAAMRSLVLGALLLSSGCSGSPSTPASSGPTLLQARDGSTLTLGTPVTVETGDPSAPALATDPRSGRVYLAWARQSATAGPFGGHLGRPVLATSSDGGVTFTPAVVVQATADVQAPQVLAISPHGTVLDAWASFKPNPATPFGEFTYRLGRSTDHGASFAVATVTDGGIQSVSRPNLMVDEQGQAWAAWLDGRPVDRTSSDPLYNVAVAVSRDDGANFTPSWTVKGNACNCCRPSIVNRPGHKDTFALVWRDVVQQPGTENHGMEMDGMNPDGSSAPGRMYPRTDVRNVKVAFSDDGGHDFGAATPVSDFGWRIQACPTIGPSVWYSHDGSKLRLAWFTGATDHVGVYFVESPDGGRHFAKPVRLSGDIVGEGYDIATAQGPHDSSYIAWGTPDKHVQVARIDADGTVHRSQVLNGDRAALAGVGEGALLSYVQEDRLVVQYVR